MFKNDYYWDSVSEQVSKIFCRIFNREMSILEIGFSGGHFLEWFNANGYKKLTGIEVRSEQYYKTLEKFSKKELPIKLINDDVLNHTESYDAVYSTGLLQCINEKERLGFIKYISNLSNLAFFTVPEILENRNEDSDLRIGGGGCKEFITSNIPYDLSLFYDIVKVGRIEKNVSHIDKTFIYYICERNN